jgi:magnesium-transporting ATPase (P-type)
MPTQTAAAARVRLLEAGFRVPAVSRVLRSSAAEVDESLLTGESETVAKSTGGWGAIPMDERLRILQAGVTHPATEPRP